MKRHELRTRRLISVLFVFACGPLPAGALSAAERVMSSRDGVTVWLAETPFAGDLAALQQGAWRTVSADALPPAAAGFPVVASNTLVAALAAKADRWNLYTRQGEALTPRGELVLPPSAAQVRIVAAEQTSGLAVEALANDQRQYTLALANAGILEFRPGRCDALHVRSRLAYAIVPSLVGTDLVYRPGDFPKAERVFTPSLNLAVGLLGQGDALLVGAWPPGKQTASLVPDAAGGSKAFDGLALDTAGQSCYLAFIEHPRLWHVETLRPEYLERDTPLAWQRPFEARWIGQFFIESDKYHFPFYFRSQKAKLWGRYIRSWFTYPFWFEGDKTLIHFEKKFPPKGELLIYYLETPAATTGVSSPIAVMQRALGQDLAARLLDFDGVNLRLLNTHGNAVCAMTRQIEEALAAGKADRVRQAVDSFADDVASFIQLIRERVLEYAAFSAQTKEFLAAQVKAQPALAEDVKGLEDLLDEIQDRARHDLPKSSLDEVRQWTDSIKAAGHSLQPDSQARVKKLAAQCRSVAGTQDDLARELSVLTIRFLEEAAAVGAKSPAHVRLAEQLIAKCRAVLRRPTWWEPARLYIPKSDPGIP